MKKQNNLGFSLIELLIAMTIGLIMLTGLITVFDTVANMNRTQNGLARLQENGRYAMTLIKQNLEQAGYQYCLGSSINDTKINDPVYPQPWVVFSPSLAPGMPVRADVSQSPATITSEPYLIDTAYFLHGHECSGSSCAPSLTSLGSATSFAIPAVGKNLGDRIVNTDVLTFRYISGSGRMVNFVSTNSATGQVNIAFSQVGGSSVLDNPVSNTSRVVIPGCSNPAVVLDLVTLGNLNATAQIPVGSLRRINIAPTSLSRMFDLNTSTSTVTYYVANNVIDGRDIPTLYSVNNGVSNAIVQGVDRFDVLYNVRTNTGAVRILNANQVENLPTVQCVPTNRVFGMNLINTPGCGWRSVVSIEVHLLLNTIYNSSLRATEPFKYSIDSNSLQISSVSPSEIKHYKMFRKEFVTTVTLKNY